MLRILGYLVLASGLAAIWMFHTGWKIKHPGEPWPRMAVFSFGGVLLAGVGLISNHMTVAIVGGVLWLLGRVSGGKPAR